MGLFNKLKQVLSSQAEEDSKTAVEVEFNYSPKSEPAEPIASEFPPIGNPDAICPYCEFKLDKMPGRKKKCPACGNFIYVRTRPADQQKVLVTEEQTAEIEEQWAIINGTYDQYIESKESFEKEKAILSERFGHSASDNDVKWSLLNKELLTHATNGDWGLYRNSKLGMADILRKEGKLEQALSFYLEICFIDLNGPSNVGGLKGSPDLLEKYPPFREDEAFLAPGIIGYISRIIKNLQLDVDQVKAIYMEVAQREYKNLSLPIAPEIAWQTIEPELING